MTARSSADHGPVSAQAVAAGHRELARLRQDVLLALGVKVLALALIGFLFFGSSHRVRVDPAALFAAVPSPSTTNR
jgi:hypothetical protein